MNDTLADIATARTGRGGPAARKKKRPAGPNSGPGPGDGLSILMLTPFSPYPADAGQRKRVEQVMQVMQDLGFSITLLLYAFEGPWLWRYQPEAVDELRARYDEVLVFPATHAVGSPPNYGSYHALDEWWDDLLDSYLQRLLQVRHFDIVMVHNVWLSKAVTLAASRTVKIIDTHDICSLRERAYADFGITPEFFRVTENDELFGLNRSDICLSISLGEAKYLAAAVNGPKVVYLPYVPAAAPATASLRKKDLEYLSEEKVVFGFIGSSHAFNIAGVDMLLNALIDVIGDTCAPVELVFAGTICGGLTKFSDRVAMRLLGRIEDEEAFYEMVDYVVVPVFSGSGFKVKVADIFERRKPALFSDHAVEELSIDPSLVYSGAEGMARAIANIALNRPTLSYTADLIDKARNRLSTAAENGIKSFVFLLNQTLAQCVMDLRGVGSRKPLIVLSLFSAIRELKDAVRILILVDEVEPWLENAAGYLPSAVSVSDDPEIHHGMQCVWWQIAGTGSCKRPNKAARVITDLRFVDRSDVGGIAGELIVAPDHAAQSAAYGDATWHFLPYLTSTSLWDPAAAVVLRECYGSSGSNGLIPAEGEPETIVALVDADHGLEPVRGLMARVGVDVRIVDLRNDRDTGALIADLGRASAVEATAPLIYDGCTGASPLRFMAVEMALLRGIPIATGAFGFPQDIVGPDLEHYRLRKEREDNLAYRQIVAGLDNLRGSVRRRGA